MSDEVETPIDDPSRRAFLKKSLVAGAVAWSAPAIASLPGGRAWAQTYGRCNCTASAYGLYVNILGIITTTLPTTPNSCTVGPVNFGNATLAAVGAGIICQSQNSTVNGNCSAQGTVASLNVRVGTTLAPTLTVASTTIQADAAGRCGQCETGVAATGSSFLQSLTVGGSLIGPNPINVNVLNVCNLDVLGLGLVKVNEQTCDPNTGQISVNALHIRVPATGPALVEVIAAHAQAGAFNTVTGTPCGCRTCSNA